MGLLQLCCGCIRVNHDNWVTVGSVPLWNISPSLDVVYTDLPVISAGRALNNRVTDGHMCYSQVKCQHVLLNTFFFPNGLQNQKAADKKLSFFNSPNICNCSSLCSRWCLKCFAHIWKERRFFASKTTTVAATGIVAFLEITSIIIVIIIINCISVVVSAEIPLAPKFLAAAVCLDVCHASTAGQLWWQIAYLPSALTNCSQVPALGAH